MRRNKNKDKAQEWNDSQQYAKGHWGGRDKLKQVNKYKCSKHEQKPKYKI